ncbi:MAG: SRPBCC family protein [Proteobacteria bacterium]|nr:SRPBCC family protein [Pseudomonadota bacterium]
MIFNTRKTYNVSREVTFTGAKQDVFAGISRYDLYPKFIAGVSDVTILSSEDDKVTVKFDLNLIRKFSYILNMEHTDDQFIRWHLKSSDFLTCNSGLWQLRSSGKNETIARYELEIGFKLFIPKGVIKKITDSSLPMMFKGMQAVIDCHKTNKNKSEK